MRMRFTAWTALIGLLALAAPTQADKRKVATSVPTVIVRLKSLDGLIADGRYLAEQAGKAEEAKQGEALLKQLAGPKGLAGIETKKPIGMYGRLGPNAVDSEAVVLLPIADEDAALDFLKKFAKPEKGEDGVYTVNIPPAPFPIFFRFANSYAYITIRDKEVIDKDKLLKPGDVLPEGKIGTMSATINVDQIPKQIKQTVIGQSEIKAANEKENKKPGETESQQAFRSALIDEGTAFLKQVLSEGGPIDLRMDIDREAGELAITSSLAGLPETKLADDVQALGKLKSAVAGIVGPDSAINIFLHASLPARLRKALEPVIEEARDEKLKKAPNKEERELMEVGWKAIMPTLKSGELDGGICLSGPREGGKYSIVLGIKVKNGSAIEKVVRDALEKAPGDVTEKVKLDIATVDDIKIHQVVGGGMDKKAKELLGEGPVYFAISDEVILGGGGEKGLDTFKKAVGAAGKANPIAQMEISLNRFAKTMEKDQPGALGASKKAFANDPSADKMRFTLNGGKALAFKFSMSAPVLRFLLLLEEAKKKGGDDN